jgi:hypothetical protein
MKKFVQDKKSFSLSFFFDGKKISNLEILNFLKRKSKNFKKNCRISINPTSKKKINFMIIFQQKGFIPAPKYYFKKDKIFYCQKGALLFFFLNEKNKFQDKKGVGGDGVGYRLLNQGEFLFIKALTKYSNVSIKKVTIHHEILPGPASKKTHYRYRKIIKLSKAEQNKINKLINKYI